MQFNTLAITGFDGAPIRNGFIRHEGHADHLAILLPGMRYSNDMPLFYYAEELALENKADVLRVDYDYRHVGGEDELHRRMAADLSAAMEAGMSQRPDYHAFTLIGKSLGTLAIAYLLEHQLVPIETRCVWLTPLLKSETVRDRLLLHPGPSFIAIGTEDPHFDAAWLAQWQTATSGTLSIVDGGDHSLSIPGDIPRSIDALRDVITALQNFPTCR